MANRVSRIGPLWVVLAFGLVAGLALLYWQQARSQAFVTESRLNAARAVQELVEQQIKQALDTRVELIAGNQAFIGYITQALGDSLPGTVVDTASIVDILEERRTQLGLSIAAVFDGQGLLIASRDGISERQNSASRFLIEQAGKANVTAHGLWTDGERMYFVAMVPLAAYGSDAGFLLLGNVLDDGMATTIGKASDADVALFAVGGPEPVLTAKSAGAASDPNAWDSERRDVGAEGRFETRKASGYFAPLFGSPAGELKVVVHSASRWMSAVMQGLPLLIGLGLGVVAMFLTVRLSNARVTSHAQELARVLDHAAKTGDYHLKVSVSKSVVLRPVAAAFNSLMERLNRSEP